MIHNVDSYTTNITSQEHNLSNCVHKHSGNWLDTDMDIHSSRQEMAPQQTVETKMSLFDHVAMNMKKIFGNGISLLRGIWNDSTDTGNKSESSGVVKGEELQQGNKITNELSTNNLAAMESVVDVKVQKRSEAETTPERWKLSIAIPALKVKTGQARERFEAGKEAFLKRMKEMAKSRQNAFSDKKEERPGQQEKEMEWFEMGNSHLLDSYDKNGEYTNLGNRKEGTGYSGNTMKENYSQKA